MVQNIESLSMSNIHPSAVIDKRARVADSATIGAYAVIEGETIIEDGVVIEPYAHICPGAILRKDCKICSFCTISGLPQDLHFDISIPTYAEIGERTVVREGTTVHRATFEGKSTIVGKDCLLMVNSHLGHDTRLGDRVILASFSAVAGHSTVDDDTFISGGVMVHQKVRIGCGCMVSGNSAFSKDIAPYVNAYERNDMAGLNLIGLMRRKTPREAIANLKQLYAAVFSGGNPRKNAQAAMDGGLVKSREGEKFVRFFTDAPEGRHFLTPRRRRDFEQL